MRKVKRRLVALSAGALLLCGAPAQVLAQRYRVRVYNPGRHARTRQVMSDRAAARAALKKKKKAAGVRRTISRPAAN